MARRFCSKVVARFSADSIAVSLVGKDSMSEVLPVLYMARHGETEWSVSGQHTGLSDLPLTLNDERNARRLGERLKGMTFARVFTSPLRRAARTCELAGFGAVAEVDPDLVEWNYGQYEGRRSVEIHAECPDWQLFRDGYPEVNHQHKWARGRTVLPIVFAQFRETYCSSPADTSFGFWQPAGWRSVRDRRASIFS